MSAPERIWANEGLEWHSFDCSDVKAGWTHPYILATPAALAASPEVQALIREAEALVVERAAQLAEDGLLSVDGGLAAQEIRALADTDGLAAVDALRAGRDAALAANRGLVRLNERTEADRDRLAAELAAAQQREVGLRVEIADMANSINIVGSEYDKAIKAIDGMVSFVKQRSRAALSNNGRGE